MNVHLISERSGGYDAIDTGELAVIDVGNGLEVELHPDEHGRKRENDPGVGYGPPVEASPFATGGVEQCSDTLEEHHDKNPWNEPNGRSEHGQTRAGVRGVFHIP